MPDGRERSKATTEAKLAVSGATKFYQTRTGAVHALDNVSIDVREGEFLCIIGPSGCGKTTLLWSMAGLHPLTSGRITIDGEADHQAASGDRDDLPGRKPAAVADAGEEHRAAVRAETRRGPTRAHQPAPRARRPGRLRQQVSARAFRRHAAARLDRPQPRRRSVGAADGRAVRRARRLHPRRDEPADPGDLDGDRQDHRLRHPFDSRGDLPRRPHRRHVGAAGPHRLGLRRRHPASAPGRRSRPSRNSSRGSWRSRRASTTSAAAGPITR